MEDTEEDNKDEVGDDDQEFEDRELQFKVKSDFRSSICEKSSADQISEEAIKIVQEQNKSKIATAAGDVCHVDGMATFKINNNIWKCELEINI